jgi:very-short-patch-repair endonuclease
MKKLSYNEVQEYIKSQGCELLSDNYINSRTKIHILCNCGNTEWYTKFNDFKNGQRCRKCGYKKSAINFIKTRIKKTGSLNITHPELCKEWDFERNKNILPENISFGSTKKIWWVCKKCGNKWESSPNTRTNDVCACPRCRASKGEKLIIEILKSKNIKYFYNYRFDNCKYILPLPFDFYLPDYKLCIEYDGEQHFSITRFHKLNMNRAIANLENRKIRDNIKNQYCKNNNIRIIRIPYWKYSDIDSILEESLSL